MAQTPLQTVDGGGVTSALGFRAGGAYCGLKKYGGKLDLALLLADRPCAAAGVFTQNRMKAAPVQLCQNRLGAGGRAQAVLVNSGLANAGTGAEGLRIAEGMSRLAATRLQLDPALVLVSSTGKIGLQIPLDKIENGLAQLSVSESGGATFAQAIMTTDSRPKEIAVRYQDESGAWITVGGACKGAGMIHPNMATMLAFVTTDAAADPAYLQQALKAAAERTFNMITIDGDTSTNDTLLVLASGIAGNAPLVAGAPSAAAFQSALDAVCLHLAREIARDGEGASRLMNITVCGAATLADARQAARTIASSNLVKTAVHGADPNWGRIVAAVGRSGAAMEQERVDVVVGDTWLMKDGQPLPFDAQAASGHLKQGEVFITVDLHIGHSQATAWGCDMSEEYVTFNSDYTT